MTLSLLFWLLMLFWVIFAVLPLFAPAHPWIGHGSNLLLFVLFLILGWHAFGAPIK